MFPNSWRRFLNNLFPRARRRHYTGQSRPSPRPYRPLRLERLEDRLAPATFTDAGTQLNLALTTANSNVAIVSNGSNYTLSLTGDTWSGTNDANVTGNGTATLTVTAAGQTAFTTGISIADTVTGTGTSVTFNDSGANAYVNNFTIGLHYSPALPGLTFIGTSAFGAFNLDATVDSSISVASGASVSTTSANLTLSANQQATPTAGKFFGIEVNGATVESATGNVLLGGTGGNDAGGSQVGIAILSGGIVRTTGGSGTVTIQGTGGASAGDANDGVGLLGSGSEVTSGGGAVSVTGTGQGSGTDNYGIQVASGGVVSVTGSGTLTVNGTGSTSGTSGDIGVLLDGTGGSSQVASAGGLLSVTGKAGDTSSAGIQLQNGGSIATTGSANLTGTSSSIAEADTTSFISAALLTTNSVGGTTLIGRNTVSRFHATNSGSGAISLTNTSSTLTITGITNSGSGNVTVNNTGAVTVTGPVSAAGGSAGISLTADSPITVSANVTAPGTINLTTAETASEGPPTNAPLPDPDDDLTVNGGVTLESTAGNVDLTSGDSILIQSGAILKADTGTIYLAPGQSDNDNDARLVNNGLLIYGTAALGLTQAATPGSVVAGQDVTYTITVTNVGPSLIQNVLLTDAVPAGTTFVSQAQTNGPAFAFSNPSVGGTGTVTGTISTLAAGASATFTVVVQADANGLTLTNTASVSKSTSFPNPGSITATTTVTVDHTLPPPSVSVAMSPGGEGLGIVTPSVSSNSSPRLASSLSSAASSRPAWRSTRWATGCWTWSTRTVRWCSTTPPGCTPCSGTFRASVWRSGRWAKCWTWCSRTACWRSRTRAAFTRC